MSSDLISLQLEKRTILGKKVKHLAKEEKVPAVIHNHGEESVVAEGPYLEMYRIYQKAGKHHPVALKVGDKDFLVLIKDVDFEPRKNRLRHVVFNAINQNEKQKTEVPVHLEGEIPAEKAGHMLICNLEVVEIEALPKDLIDEFVVDATSLAEIGDKLTVADLKAPEGVTILTEPEHPIATIEETKAQISEEAEEEAEGEAAEGEEGAEGAEGKESAEAKQEDKKE